MGFKMQFQADFNKDSITAMLFDVRKVVREVE